MVENSKILQLSAKSIYLKKRKKNSNEARGYRFYVTQNEDWNKKTKLTPWE